GMVLAPAGYAVFQFDSELSARLDGTWLQAAMHYLPLSMVKEIGMTFSLLGVVCLVGGYAIQYVNGTLQAASARLWHKYIRLRRLEPVDLDPERLIQLVFELGDARNPGSFVRKETLRWLLRTNPQYVQAWGVASSGGQNYRSVCFFVVAPLNARGRGDMESRAIKKNKDLHTEHVAPSFTKCSALYIIEVFGSSFFSKGAVLHLLGRCLERKLSRNLLDGRLKVFTRPVNEFGYRQIRRYGFTNLGDATYEMHVWQAQQAGGYCSGSTRSAGTVGASSP
ncbi:MAG: hypothetical protein M0T84_18500, partial [Betaproteobacteria bacterium]|nr:hypothetical protein [Betaproteobacteria bacterium]